jgi:hypothetical protein
MTEKLDGFRPSAEVLAGVRRQLVSAGVDPDTIPEDWLFAIVAAMTKWSFRTPSGLEFSLQWLGAQTKKGLDDFDYEYSDSQTGNSYQINPDRVMYFAGASVNGYPVDPQSIYSSKKEENQCDSCGTRRHCVKDVRDPVKDRLESYCNACLSYHDNPRLSSGCSVHKCETCTDVGCYHNPRYRKDQRLKLA